MTSNSLDSLEYVHLPVLDDLLDARVCRAVHAAPVYIIPITFLWMTSSQVVDEIQPGVDEI
jgi:hypothetical protein